MKHLSKLLKSAIFFTPPKFFFTPPPRFSDKVKHYLRNFLPTLVRSFVRSSGLKFLSAVSPNSNQLRLYYPLKFLSAFSKNHSFILKLICVGGWITLHGTSCTHLQSHKSQAKQAAATTTPQSKEEGSRSLAGGRRSDAIHSLLGSLGDIGKTVSGRDKIQQLRLLSRAKDPNIKIAVVRLLDSYSSAEMEILVRLARDPDPRVKIAVVKNLDLESDIGIALLKQLGQDPHPYVEQAAFRVFSQWIDSGTYNLRLLIDNFILALDNNLASSFLRSVKNASEQKRYALKYLRIVETIDRYDGTKRIWVLLSRFSIHSSPIVRSIVPAHLDPRKPEHQRILRQLLTDRDYEVRKEAEKRIGDL